MSTHAEIWKALSSVDVTKHVEKKGKLSYLSWAWAWGILMEHFPEAEVTWDHDPQVESDGSITVWCEIQIGECSRRLWLPVMDHRNQAIANPDAREISDARMRCFVKTLALFGLGFSLYAGEDLPASPITPPARSKRAARSRKAPQMGSANRAAVKGAVDARLGEIGDFSITQNECLRSVAALRGLSSPIEFEDDDLSEILEQIGSWEPPLAAAAGGEA